METIDISETHDAMTMKVDINHINRKKPYKYVIKFDRHNLQEILDFGSHQELLDFYANLRSTVETHHKKTKGN
jgi:hypothetical protein